MPCFMIIIEYYFVILYEVSAIIRVGSNKAGPRAYPYEQPILQPQEVPVRV